MINSEPAVKHIPKPDLQIKSPTYTKVNKQDYTIHAIPTILSKSEYQDYYIQIRASTLSNLRNSAIVAKAEKYNYSEFILAIASASGSLLFNYYNRPIGWLLGFFTGILFTIYFFVHRRNTTTSQDIATKVLEILPNPDENIPK